MACFVPWLIFCLYTGRSLNEAHQKLIRFNGED